MEKCKQKNMSSMIAITNKMCKIIELTLFCIFTLTD